MGRNKLISGFRLSKRDPYILKAINDCQALTISQLITLFWNSPNPAYTRLRKLCEHGYIEKYYITQITTAPASSPIIYTISKQGALVLFEHFRYEKEDIHYISRQIKNWQSYQPIKATNDIRIALTRACQESEEHELVTWRNEAEFRSDPDQVFVGGKAKRVYPDGFCIVRKGKAKTYNFIEADNGTEGLRQVESQLEIYLNYTMSGLYQQRFGTKYWRVLFITNSTKRMNNIRKRVRKIGGGANFWFSTYDLITVQSVLNKPIWTKATEETPVVFI